MAIVVQKFGGSSVADAACIKRVAARIGETFDQGHQVVVVVSAMGDTTDDLISLAKKLTASPPISGAASRRITSAPEPCAHSSGTNPKRIIVPTDQTIKAPPNPMRLFVSYHGTSIGDGSDAICSNSSTLFFAASSAVAQSSMGAPPASAQWSRPSSSVGSRARA